MKTHCLLSQAVLGRTVSHEREEAGFADRQPFAWGGQLPRSLLSSCFLLLSAHKAKARWVPSGRMLSLSKYNWRLKKDLKISWYLIIFYIYFNYFSHTSIWFCISILRNLSNPCLTDRITWKTTKKHIEKLSKLGEDIAVMRWLRVPRAGCNLKTNAVHFYVLKGLV